MLRRTVALGAAMACWMGALGAAGAEPAGRLANADFFVAVDGNDAWSGRRAAREGGGTEGPFATVGRARDAVRAERTKDAKPRPYRVLVRGGTYRLAKALVFTPADSGAAEAPVTYAAYPAEKPVVSGGRLVTGWTPGAGKLWTATIPEVKAGRWYARQLFVNGQRRTRARTPNQGYLRTAGPLVPLGDRRQARRDVTKKMGFRYNAGDLRRWDNLGDVNLFVYQMWTAGVQWIKELDPQKRTVRFTAPMCWPVGHWERRQRYTIANYREALDAPGEWYLDRKTGVLTYWPMPGEHPRTMQAVVPMFNELVRFDGDPGKGQWVSHVRLQGLSFQHAAWDIPTNRTADGQAAAFLTTAAVLARGARHCAMVDCEVAHGGTYGIWFAGGCTDNRIVHCHVHDTGAGGIRIGEGRSPKTEAHAALRNVIDNCFIHDGGYVFHAGVGVWIGRSSFNRVTHNEICDFDYTGVSVGWQWGYGRTTAHHNVVEYNHIHDVGRGVLSDMGGIYTLGISPGTRIRHNVIHDCWSAAPNGAGGIYPDEGSSQILIENNLCYDTAAGGFTLHYGRDLTVRNNILAISDGAQLVRGRPEDHKSVDLHHNIVYCTGGALLRGSWTTGGNRLDHNLYWHTQQSHPQFLGKSFAQWQQAGYDRHSRVADPLFVDPGKRDFRLKPASPARSLGFQPFDTSRVGLYGDRAWVEAPKQIVRPPVKRPEPPGPEPIDDGFEASRAGDSPDQAHVLGEEKGASIRVTDELAAAGKHCLKFTDAPGLKHVWQPHMYYQPNFRKGVARLRFDLRLAKGASVWHEWRHYPGHEGEFNVGPSLSIDPAGRLAARDRPLLTLPHDQWVRVEVTCALGPTRKGTYALTVAVPGRPRASFPRLPIPSTHFHHLHWLGFVSNATDKAVFHIDNVALVLTP